MKSLASGQGQTILLVDDETTLTAVLERKKQVRGSEPGANPGVKLKKISLRIDTSNSNLAFEIKRAFNLAKSSGLELDLTFGH